MSTNSESKIDLTKDKTTEFSEWYTDVVIKTELLDYYPISGCYIMLPFSYKMWENIQQYVDIQLKSLGVDNVYFPLLIPETYLNKEQNHISGFTPEVVWVSKIGTTEQITAQPTQPAPAQPTQSDQPAQQAQQAQQNIKLAIRPTSETAIYPTFANKIRTHADLPILWNQWTNVMRWEFSSATPFIRSREFLWQEGHCAFKNNFEMYENVKNILKIYKNTYEDFLSVPVIVGKKIESEKFAGADETFSIETFIPEANKSIQCATVHNLGKNFSKMFEIMYSTENNTIDNPVQSSWGLTTRSIGTAIMTHSDNKGLVLSPYFAPIQIVIIPINFSKDVEMNEKIKEHSENLYKKLIKNFRVKLDTSDRRPGWKYHHWETKGVSLRIEIGPKDIQNKTLTLVKRNDGKKFTTNIDEFNDDYVNNLFTQIKQELFTDASKNILSTRIYEKETIHEATNKKSLILVNLCNKLECDEYIRSLRIKPICRPICIETLNVNKFDHLNDKKLNCIVCNDECNMPCYLGKTF